MDYSGLPLAAHPMVATGEVINLNRQGIPGQAILLVAVIAYLICLLGLSLLASSKVQNEEDFLVAGRRLGFFLCWGSLIATWFGAETMMGSSSAAREEGMRGTILDPWGCSFALVIAGIFYAPRLWRMKLLTTGDFFRRVYGPRAEMVCCAVQIPSYFGWIAGQYVSLAAVQSAYFGIPDTWGILLGFAVALLYTMVGGMWSVTLIDTIQIVIAFAGLMVLGAASFAAFGTTADSNEPSISLINVTSGVARFWREIPPDDLSLLPPLDATAAMIVAYLSTWATGIFGNIPGQDLQQRIFSARSARTATLACVCSGLSYLGFSLVPVGIGLMSRLEFPLADTVLPIRVLMSMAGRTMSVPLAIIFVVSFVSIVMSTACSGMLAAGTILGHNFLGRWSVFRAKTLTVERISVLLVSLGGLALAFAGESLFELLDLSLSIALTGLFVPLTMGLFGRPRGELPAILATVLGITCYCGRNLPEMVLMPLPPALQARSSLESRFAERRQKLTAEERKSEEILRHTVGQARREALLEMEQTLALYLPQPTAKALATERFETGFEWLEYLEFRFPAHRVGEARFRILMLLGSISADLYGLTASLLGYCVGQSVLKRHGFTWNPDVLLPPESRSPSIPAASELIPSTRAS